MANAAFAIKISFLMSGFIVWAVHFLFIYGFNSLACTRGASGTTLIDPDLVPLTLTIATVIGGALDLVILSAAVAGRGPGIAGESDDALRAFWRFVTGVIAALSLVAVVWDGLPAIMIAPCT